MKFYGDLDNDTVMRWRMEEAQQSIKHGQICWAKFSSDALDFSGVAPLQTMREHADCSDVSGLRKVARILELGKEKTGRRLTKGEVEAGLNTLWNDGGVEGAVVAVERVFRGIKSGIARNLLREILKKIM